MREGHRPSPTRILRVKKLKTNHVLQGIYSAFARISGRLSGKSVDNLEGIVDDFLHVFPVLFGGVVDDRVERDVQLIAEQSVIEMGAVGGGCEMRTQFLGKLNSREFGIPRFIESEPSHIV